MTIQESIQAVLDRSELVADLFYHDFFERHPEVRSHFAEADMRRQAVLLTMALQLMVQYYLRSFPTVKAYLQILGHEHRRRGIGRDLYPKWRATLLATLAQFHGDDWNESLSRQWSEALEVAIYVMLTAYASEAGETHSD